MIFTIFIHESGPISEESIGGSNCIVATEYPSFFNSGILSFKCWKLNDSNTPVSGFSIIPIVPPVYINRMEAFSC